jgi:hypothetical protein
MANGIDQEIQSKVDAYRGNPQALQQRYAQNQQLVDLLALQKLKSEKEAAARDMQMQMAQQPETIKQQREAELLGMTKQEMMQQTQGILQQRQAEQQKNMQQVAKGGLGALAGQRPPAPQPAPQGAPQGMPKMASGGLVAFAPGGAVGGMGGLSEDLSLQEQIDIVRRRSDLNEGQKQSLISQLRQQQPRAEEQRDFVTPVGRASSARMPGVRGNIPVGSETSALDVMSATNPQIAPKRTQNAPMGADLAGLGAGPLTRPNNAPAGGIASLGPATRPNNAPTEAAAPSPTVDAAPSPTVDAAPSPAVDPVAAASDAAANMGGIGGGSANSAMQQGFATADAYTRRNENAAEYDAMQQKLEEFDAERYDPKQEKRDQLISFLINARGTTAGSTMASGAAASLRTRDRQNAQARGRLMDQFKLAQEGMQLDMSAAETGMQLGREMYAQTMQNQRTVYSAISQMKLEQVRGLREAAQRDYDRMQDDRTYELDLMKEARLQAADAVTADNMRSDNALQALSKIHETRAALVESQLNADPEYNALMVDANQALDDGDTELARDLAERRDARYAAMVARANMVMEQEEEDGVSLLDLESDLAKAIAQGAGFSVDTEMVSPEDIIDIQ